MGWSQLALGLGLLVLVNGVQSKHVGCYYGVWAYTRPGMGEYWPEDIDVELCDVIYYGFGNVLNDTFEVCSWDPWFDLGPPEFGDTSIKNCIQERDGIAWPPGCITDAGLEYCHYDGMRRTTALKKINPNLKVLWSVGGWTAGGWIFSQMAQTKESRQKFIMSVIHFLKRFDFDGLDLDWEFPALDMLPVEPTDPNDKYHFTDLMAELRTAFDVEGFLLTIAAASDPAKAANAYELDKVKHSIDWFNVMCYDYSGAWDNFTGIDQPIYGRWEEGFAGHPKYQFNIHDSMQYYMSEGVPPEQISLGIHTEGKGWILEYPDTAEDQGTGIYCPAYEGSPNMTFSRQVGWMFYYEVLQFYYNETIEDPRWSDLKPGRDSWTIRDMATGNQDGCYMAPYAHQGQYWISYDDVDSVDLKVRYANHYNFKGAFVWEVDTDNFMGQWGHEKYTILQAINRAIIKGDGLHGDEILGTASENKGCSPQAPICDICADGSCSTPSHGPSTTTDPRPPCDHHDDCDGWNEVCNEDYSNCNYCDGEHCNPGCADDVNCDGTLVCNGHHLCFPPGTSGVTTITVKTQSCSGCGSGNAEEGLKLVLEGKYGSTQCSTNGLDNSEKHDYGNGNTAVFENMDASGRPSDDGMDTCYNGDLNLGLSGGTATWTGQGTWTPVSQDPICINFYGANKPTCCCGTSALQSNVPTDLSDCHCFMP